MSGGEGWSFIQWEGKLKLTTYLFVFLVPICAMGAQDTNEENQNIQTRPVETELLIGGEPSLNESTPSEVENLPGVGAGDFFRLILVLGLVILLVYAFFWMLKRFSGVRVESGDLIRVLSARPLKGDSVLHLVETGNHIFLVGSSGNSVNLLAEISDKESLDQIKLASSRASVPTEGGFAALFQKKFGISRQNLRGDGESSGNMEDSARYMRQQRERLKDL